VKGVGELKEYARRDSVCVGGEFGGLLCLLLSSSWNVVRVLICAVEAYQILSGQWGGTAGRQLSSCNVARVSLSTEMWPFSRGFPTASTRGLWAFVIVNSSIFREPVKAVSSVTVYSLW
jgi:hypothetical protein